MRLMPLQQRLEQLGVVVAGVVQHHHPPAAGPVAKQLPQLSIERGRIELGLHGVNELAGSQADRVKAGDGLVGEGLDDPRIPVLGRHPHVTARAVLLKVAFVQAPQFKIVRFRKPAQFFRLAACRTWGLAEGVVERVWPPYSAMHRNSIRCAAPSQPVSRNHGAHYSV